MKRKFFKALMAILILSTIPCIFLTVQPAGAHGVVVLQCTPDQLNFNKRMYWENIEGINNAVSLYLGNHPVADLNGYMHRLYPWMVVIPEYGHCIRDMGLDPASVAQLSPQAAKALIEDAPNLVGYSREFLEEIPIPNFTNTAAFPATPVISTQMPPAVPNCQDRAFPTVNWSYCNFQGSSLSKAYLWEANLTGTNFAKADLSMSYALDAKMKGADLNHANLSNTELAGAHLDMSNLVGANMVDSSLDFANMTGANLSNANLARSHGLLPVFYKSDLSNANLEGAAFVDASFENATLAGANLGSADLTGADLNGANLANANLTGTILTGAKLHCTGNQVCQ